MMRVKYQFSFNGPKEISDVARLTQYGPVIYVGKKSEILIPWSKVITVESPERDTIN